MPQADETILSRKAKDKFDEAMSMGSYLTPDMKAAFIKKLQESDNSTTEEPEQPSRELDV